MQQTDLRCCHQYTVKPVLNSHSKTRPNIVFQDPLSLDAGQKYCRMLQESILLYFLPSLSFVFSIVLFLSGRFRQVLMYYEMYIL